MFADDDEGMPFFGADGALVTPGVEPLTAEGAEALAVRAGFAPRSYVEGGTTCQRAGTADFDDPHRRHLLRQGDDCDLPTTSDGAIEDPADALPTPAPTFADDVAALRADIEILPFANALLLRLDRIAGAVPQRATASDGRPLWQHGCGRIASGPGCTGPACRSCGEVGGWRALYVIDGGA